jgi:hypothetical protein
LVFFFFFSPFWFFHPPPPPPPPTLWFLPMGGGVGGRGGGALVSVTFVVLGSSLGLFGFLDPDCDLGFFFLVGGGIIRRFRILL